MTQEDLDRILEEVQFAFFGGASADTVATPMRRLAQSQYRPALDFFITCMQGKRPEWRAQALMLVGSHYDLLGNEKGLDALRGVLQQAPDPLLRRKAAEFLGLYSDLPDGALSAALQADPDINVRFAALQAILELAGVPRLQIRDEIGMLRAGGILPTMADAERISSGRSPNMGW